MKKKPTAKPVRPAKRATKKQSKATANAVPESRPAFISRAAQSKATDPTLVFKSESWKEKEEEIEKLIANDPRNALRVAENAIDYSLELFVRLIKRKSLYIPVVPNPFEDGTKSYPPTDLAAHCLCERLCRIAEEVMEHAKAGHDRMISAAWYAAINFTKTVHDIALEHPDRLEPLAKESVFMPSLRAVPKRFNYDFPEIAETTHLSEDCVFNARPSAAYDLNLPQNGIVADCVRNVESYRPLLKHLKSLFAFCQEGAASGIVEGQIYAGFQIQKWLADECQKSAGLQLEQWLVDHHDFQSYELHYDELPPLTKKTVKCWWDNAIKGEVERRFESIKGTAFYYDLQKATDSNKDYKVRDEFKRRCLKALESLARPDPKD